MSNRSKKNVFVKEANDTLKRALVSPEFRNYMMERMTGTKPKNGRLSLDWSLSNDKYLAIENEYNEKLAGYITDLRHEMAANVNRQNATIRARVCCAIKERYRLIIPAGVFDEYWKEKMALDADLEKYRKMSYVYSDDRRRLVNEYIYSAESVLQHMYGSPLPAKKYYIEDYKAVLELYDEHKSEYGLAYPSFPKEHLVLRII